MRGKFVDGNLDEDERNLMIDGLLRRFLGSIEEAPDLGEEPVDGDDSSEEE